MKKIIILIFILTSNFTFTKSIYDYFYRLDVTYNKALYYDANTVFLAGSLGAVPVSTDNGKSWYRNYTKTNEDLNGLAVEPNTGTLFVVGNNGAVIKSSDLGKNWEKINIGTTSNLYSISFSNNIGIITGNSGELYKSQDNGLSWDLISINSTKLLKDVKIIENGRIIVVDIYSAIYITDDNFKSWKTVNLDGEISSSYSLEIKSNKEFIVIRTNLGLLISYNSGDDWIFESFNSKEIIGIEITEKNKLIGLSVTQPGDFYDYSSIYEIKCENSIVFNKLSSVIDTNYFPYPAMASGFAINPYSERKNAVVFGNYNTIAVSTDSLSTWRAKSYLYLTEWASIFFINSDVGFLGSKNARIHRTLNGGATWLPQPDTSYNLTDEVIINMIFTDKLNGKAYPNVNPVVLETNDGGETYNSKLCPGSMSNRIELFNQDIYCKVLLDSKFPNFYTELVIGDVNSGKFISKLIDSSHLYAGAFINKNKIYFAGSRNDTVIKKRPFKITHPITYVSEDFGQSWVENKLLLDITDVRSIYFINEKIGFLNAYKVTYSDSDYYINKIYKTYDGGENWKLILESNKTIFQDMKIQVDGKGIMIANSGELFITSDFGDTWQILTNHFFEKYYLRKFFVTNDCVYLIGDNALYRSIPDSLKPVTVEEPEMVENGPPPVWLYPPYPNPADKKLTFSILWDKRISENDIDIELFDLNGIKIKDFSNSPKIHELENKANITIETTDILNGIYYLKVSNQGYNSTMSVVILHK